MSDIQQALGQTLDLDDLNLDEMPDQVAIESQTLAAPHAANIKKSTMAMNGHRKMSLFSRIPVTMTLEVASVDISLSELMSVSDNSVVELDKLAGEPLDIKVNGILFGKAEVVVLNEKYGLRIIEFNNSDLSELVI